MAIDPHLYGGKKDGPENDARPEPTDRTVTRPAETGWDFFGHLQPL